MTPPARPRALRPTGAAARAVLLVCLAVLLALAPGRAPAQVPLEPAPEPAAPAEPEAPTIAEVLRLLATVLDDPEARTALVEQLRTIEPVDPAAPPPEPPEAAVPRIIADQTLTLVERVSREVTAIARGLLDVREIAANLRAFEFALIGELLLEIAAVVALTLIAHGLMRLLTRRPLAQLDAGAAAAPPALRYAYKTAAVLIDVLAVAVAWTIGWAAALATGGGEVTLARGLFLNAFLATELAKAAVRFVFRPQRAFLRPLIMQEATAAHWHFWLARIAAVLGYGLLFLVPATAPFTSPAFTGWLQLVISIVAVAMGILLVVRNRRRVRVGIEDKAARLPPGLLASSLVLLAQVWHLIAVGYLIALFVVWRAYPGEAEQFMLRATALSALAALVGALLAAAITRWIAGGITLSERRRLAMPTLEARLNRYVPAVLQVLRLLVLLAVVASILTFWGLVDFPAWLRSPAGARIVWSFLWIASILAIAGAVYIFVSAWIEYRLNPDVGTQPTARERTLLALLSNAFVVVLAVITLMTVLTELGINIAPLLAGAGVVGLAIGFGAQKLVQDIINGAFIQFENTMNEGDVVTAGGTTGVVEKLTIRSVSLRSLDGTYHMIPFSGVDTVANFMKGFSFHVAEIGVAYRESIPEVKAAMHEAFDRLIETEHRANILPPLEMQGIVAFADSAVTVRARIKTLPGQQWAAGRAYNELIKEVFDERGIEIPFPHRTIWLGEDKRGEAPPLNLRSLDRRRRGTADSGPAAAGAQQPRPLEHSDPVPPDVELTPPGSEED